MVTSVVLLLWYALLATRTLASSPSTSFTSSSSSTSSSSGVDDDLDAWLAAAKRVSPEVLKRCPVSCRETGDSHSKAGWFLFPDVSKLASCNKTMLLDMAVRTANQDDDGKKTPGPVVRACTADYEESGVRAAFVLDEKKASLCTTANRLLTEAIVQLHQPEDNGAVFSINHLLAAGRQMATHLALQMPSCTDNAIEFAYSQSAAIGLFVGAEVQQHGAGSEVLKMLLEYAHNEAVTKTTVVQLCGADGRGADYSIGIVASSAKNLPFIQEAVKTWSEGGCISGLGVGRAWNKVMLRIPEPVVSAENKNSTHEARSYLVGLGARATCKTAEVQAGDGCYAVAERCGISQDDLKKYNRDGLCSTLIKGERVCCSSGTLPSTLPPGNSDGTCKTTIVVNGDDCGTLAAKCGISAADFSKANPKKDLCSTLRKGQHVCCSDGDMPDFKPKPDDDGNCATYTTRQDDNCDSIAASFDLDIDDLETFNKKTWGWAGCKVVLYSDFKMCVSEGRPPMPASVPNAVCGPTVNGTLQPIDGVNLADLNPCPLNVCCNIWGQCGMTDDFCKESKSESGAPGTAAPGENGCISNCGRDILPSPNPPKQRIKVAYYEAWNFGRECLNMWVDQIDQDLYTHIHFAFANITEGDFKVDISDPQIKKQFDIFKQMKGVKRIVSFGGWDFSAMPGTFQILREAVKPENRETFKQNLVDFMEEHDLDGIDLDWEYPGAPDIPDIPSDDPENGLNYYKLLTSLKKAVGDDKSVSFAAPASYWYLKSFPIAKMARELDYIVYMTYDLHGQWDYNNPWTSSGCESGNCLRSHVNDTETYDALAMITKAGAPSNKVVVGVASYGRSFKMAEPGCWEVDCKFTGSPHESDALPGRCTKTAGYISNAEIDEIRQAGNVNMDALVAGSNIVVYNDTEWVAYMSRDIKEQRAKEYESYNFAGTTDWAVDLQYFVDGQGGVHDEPPEDGDEYYYPYDHWAPCTGSYSTLDQLEKRKDSLPAHCVEKYLVDVQVATLEAALNKYKDLLDKGYDKKFAVYEKYVRAQVPDQINDLMASDKVDKYFECTESIFNSCCNSCKFACGCEDHSADCKNGFIDKDMDACPKIKVPPVNPVGAEHIPNSTFTLVDADGFYDDLAETWGIEKEWIKFGRRFMLANNGCQNAGEDVNKCMDDYSTWWYNYPLAADDIEIYNPKDIIGQSYDKTKDLLERLEIVRDFAGDWDDLTQRSDLVDASSLPAFSAQEAVKGMDKVVEMADEIKKAEREEMILGFITGLLFFIPVVGEAVGAAGLTTARTMLRLIGSVGDAGLMVHDIVQDPSNAFMTVFSYLAEAGVSRRGFKDAAESRRKMTVKEYDSLGDIKKKLDRVEDIRGVMCTL